MILNNNIQEVQESWRFESKIKDTSDTWVVMKNFVNFNAKFQQMLLSNEACENTFKAVPVLNLNKHLCIVFN